MRDNHAIGQWTTLRAILASSRIIQIQEAVVSICIDALHRLQTYPTNIIPAPENQNALLHKLYSKPTLTRPQGPAPPGPRAPATINPHP